jgi:hypothetical protein
MVVAPPSDVKAFRAEREVSGATDDETKEEGSTKAMDWFIQQHSSRNRNGIVEQTAMVLSVERAESVEVRIFGVSRTPSSVKTR